MAWASAKTSFDALEESETVLSASKALQLIDLDLQRIDFGSALKSGFTGVCNGNFLTDGNLSPFLGSNGDCIAAARQNGLFSDDIAGNSAALFNRNAGCQRRLKGVCRHVVDVQANVAGNGDEQNEGYKFNDEITSPHVETPYVIVSSFARRATGLAGMIVEMACL
jgi:hypothetical protein